MRSRCCKPTRSGAAVAVDDHASTVVNCKSIELLKLYVSIQSCRFLNLSQIRSRSVMIDVGWILCAGV